MRLRRMWYSRLISSFVSDFKKILLLFIFFLFLIWFHRQDEENKYSFSKISWSSIPDYVPNISQYIIQTSKTSADINTNNNSFIRLNPTYEYIHYNDSAADEFVRKTMPEYVYRTYISLPKSVLKADYFRYIVLLVKGGIYSDIDTICLQPIDKWIDGVTLDKIGLIIGIEADASLWDIFQGDYTRQIQIVQWTIAAAPGHPILHEVVKQIADISPTMALETMTERQVLEWTGPALWTDVIANYFLVKYGFSMRNLKNLKEPERVGEDIYVLPITAFSPGLNRMGSKPITDPDAKVQHFFSGSWRNLRKKRSNEPLRIPH